MCLCVSERERDKNNYLVVSENKLHCPEEGVARELSSVFFPVKLDQLVILS